MVALILMPVVLFFSRQPQQVNTLAQLSSVSSSLQLRGRTVMMENIYDIDGGSDGGEYQYIH